MKLIDWVQGIALVSAVLAGVLTGLRDGLDAALWPFATALWILLAWRYRRDAERAWRGYSVVHKWLWDMLRESGVVKDTDPSSDK
jgi:hypothetical protein